MLDARSKILCYTQKFFSLADNAQIFQFSKMLERKDTVLDSIPTCYIILKSWRCAWNRCEYFVTSTNIPTQQVQVLKRRLLHEDYRAILLFFDAPFSRPFCFIFGGNTVFVTTYRTF